MRRSSPSCARRGRCRHRRRARCGFSATSGSRLFISMRRGASVSQLLAVSSRPCGARMMRVLSSRQAHRVAPSKVGRSSAQAPRDSAPDETSSVTRLADVRRKVAIVGEPRDVARGSARARVRAATLDCERRVEIAALRGSDQLDADDARRRSRPCGQAPRAVRRHGDMVLLIGGGRYRSRRLPDAPVACSRTRGRGGHLRDHQARIDPGSGVRNAGKPDRARIDQQRDAPLGQRSDLTDGERQDVGREGDRLAMEIAAGQNFAGLGE